MLPLIFGTLGTFMSFFGIFTNLYVFVVLIQNKKTRNSSEWILLHLSSCGLLSSFFNLFFISPSVFLERWIASVGAGCNFVGACTLSLQLLIVWSICALSFDRCAAIVSPLRYTQLVTRRRIAIFIAAAWVLTLITVLASFLPRLNTTVDADVSTTESLILNDLSNGEIVSSSTTPIISSKNTIVIQNVNSATQKPQYISSSPSSVTHLVIELYRTSYSSGFDSDGNSGKSGRTDESSLSDIVNNTFTNEIDLEVMNTTLSGNGDGATASFQYRALIGVCLPKMHGFSWPNLTWVSSWILLILIAPMITLLICDFTVLSIARKQRHRIVMALYQITAVTQVTVTGSKGTNLPNLWLNRSVPPRSRACRAVWEDMATLIMLHLPLIVIFTLETILTSHKVPQPVDLVASLSLFVTPSLTAVLYGIRARPLRAAYKSYLRKRLTNSTLQHEIQQRLSPVDGSPRPSSRAKSFRSSTPSPNSSPICTPRRLSTNDLRPPPAYATMTMSPSHGHLGRAHNGTAMSRSYKSDLGDTGRKVRSFLHIPSQVDMQEFWSGLRRPNRSPTIVITHEIRIKSSTSSVFGTSPPQTLTATEQRL